VSLVSTYPRRWRFPRAKPCLTTGPPVRRAPRAPTQAQETATHRAAAWSSPPTVCCLPRAISVGTKGCPYGRYTVRASAAARQSVAAGRWGGAGSDAAAAGGGGCLAALGSAQPQAASSTGRRSRSRSSRNEFPTLEFPHGIPPGQQAAAAADEKAAAGRAVRCALCAVRCCLCVWLHAQRSGRS
jgi:hypothetical protein